MLGIASTPSKAWAVSKQSTAVFIHLCNKGIEAVPVVLQPHIGRQFVAGLRLDHPASCTGHCDGR